MKRILSTALLALAVAGSSGCATIFAGGPSQLDVTVPGPAAGTTTIVRGVMNDRMEVHHEPNFKTELDRGTPYAVSISRDGYEPQLYIVKLEINPYYWLNYAPLVVATGLQLTSPNMDTTTRGYIASAALGWIIVGPVVDLLTKAAYQHDTHAINAELVKKDMQAPASR
jgi:hypothetical protein